MTRNLRNILLTVAERHLRFFEDATPMSRELATALIPQLPLLVGLDDDFRAELLTRFNVAEPVMVAGRDYLPEGSTPQHSAGYSSVSAGCWSANCSCGWSSHLLPDRDHAVFAFRRHLDVVDVLAVVLA